MRKMFRDKVDYHTLQYELMQQVREELRSWNDTLKPDLMPRDPVDFSFWVAGNLPLDDNMKLHLLRVDSAVQRLRCQLSIMRKVQLIKPPINTVQHSIIISIISHHSKYTEQLQCLYSDSKL